MFIYFYNPKFGFYFLTNAFSIFACHSPYILTPVSFIFCLMFFCSRSSFWPCSFYHTSIIRLCYSSLYFNVFPIICHLFSLSIYYWLPLSYCLSDVVICSSFSSTYSLHLSQNKQFFELLTCFSIFYLLSTQLTLLTAVWVYKHFLLGIFTFFDVSSLFFLRNVSFAYSILILISHCLL